MRKKSGKRSLRHITSSILLVIVAFLMAITSTLAWISMNITSDVRGMDFEVTSQGDLKIAVKQWKYREITAIKVSAARIELTRNEESGEYTYSYNEAQRIAQTANIHNYNNKNYVYVTDSGEEINPRLVASESGAYYVYYSDGAPFDVSDFEEVVQNGSSYNFSGYILVDPEDEDYTHEITEEQLSKVCMHNKDAVEITDVLTTGTTRNDEDGYAKSITDIVDIDGNRFVPNSLAKGGRYTATTSGMPLATAYKYEFDLFFMSDSDFSMVLNTRQSSVRGDPNSTALHDVEAWRNINIDSHTTDVNIKNYYDTYYGSRDTVKEGDKIYAQFKNAVRVGFSDRDNNPIAIWDPNASFGWTRNDPESNLALEYYNAVKGTRLVGAPAKALLNSDTTIYGNMIKGGDGKYRASIKVTIWLEGFDGDCFDAIMNESIRFGFDFAGFAPFDLPVAP